MDFYRQALAKDPNYARAYAGLADAYSALGSGVFGGMRPSDVFPRAKAAMSKALSLDDSLAEAHAAHARCALFYDWDWDVAERAVRRALELDSGNIITRVLHGNLLFVTGRIDEGIQEARRTAEMEPLSVNTIGWLGVSLVFGRRYDEASDVLKKALEMDPSFVPAHLVLVNAYAMKGQVQEAKEYTERLASQFKIPAFLCMKGVLSAILGRNEEALQVLSEIKKLSESHYISASLYAGIYYALGDVESWKTAMKQAFEQHDVGLVFLKVFPWNDPIRTEPLYQELVAKIGLP